MEAILYISLTPEQARIVGAWAIVLVLALDLIASSDNVPFNTPRDWLLWLTQWKSLWLWSEVKRRAVREVGWKWAPRMPLNYLPMTGAGIPFMFAALLGHFFHPGLGPLIGPGGFVGLGVCLIAAITISVVTYFIKFFKGEHMVFWIALAGFVFGVLIWPVSS